MLSCLLMQLPSHQFHPCKSQKLFIGIYYQLNNSVYIEQEQLIEGHDNHNAVVFNYSIFVKKNLHLEALISMGDSRHNHTVNFSK